MSLPPSQNSPNNNGTNSSHPHHYRSISEQEEWDAPLLALTEKSNGDLRRLFYAVFSFLHRRTDFYMIPSDDQDEAVPMMKMGFRQGDAERALIAAFRQFPLRKIPNITRNISIPSTHRIEGTTENFSDRHVTNTENSNNSTMMDNNTLTIQKNEQSQIIRPPQVQYTELGKQIPVGNGGSTSSYQWTQTLDEVTIFSLLPQGTRAKDLDVLIKSTCISVKLKKETSLNHFLDGKFPSKVKLDECTWTMEGEVLLITLEKAVKTWWDCILEGDEKIDTSLVDSSRKVSEYDASTQGMIRKIIFDQQQQRLGQPTSDEILGKSSLPPLPPGVEYIDHSNFPTNPKVLNN